MVFRYALIMRLRRLPSNEHWRQGCPPSPQQYSLLDLSGKLTQSLDEHSRMNDHYRGNGLTPICGCGDRIDASYTEQSPGVQPPTVAAGSSRLEQYYCCTFKACRAVPSAPSPSSWPSSLDISDTAEVSASPPDSGCSLPSSDPLSSDAADSPVVPMIASGFVPSPQTYRSNYELRLLGKQLVVLTRCVATPDGSRITRCGN